MLLSKRFILFLLSVILGFTMHGQPFTCNGKLILTNTTSSTTSYNISFGPFGLVTYSPFVSYLNEGFDALGFNPKDNYIYGVQLNTNSIARLKSDGSFEIIGSLAQLDAFNVSAGDCSPDGKYLCYDNDLNQILVFNVADDFELVDQIDLFWNPNGLNSGPFKTRLEDFAINPFNPKIAYSFQGNYNQADLEPVATRGRILVLNLDDSDPNFGMVTPSTYISSNVIKQIGSLFFTEGGGLYGYGTYNSGSDPVYNRLISINTFTGEVAIEDSDGPTAPIGDGCSCPYGLSFTNSVTPNFATCSDSEITFTLSINNRSNELLSNLKLTNTLPNGLTITDIRGNFNGNLVTGSGVGTSLFEIDNLSISPNEFLEIKLEAYIDDLPIGLIANQATLSNLPPLFGGLLNSDNLATPGYVGDSTKFFSDPLNIDNYEITIIPPSDCLSPNDAKVYFSSAQLNPNQNYELLLIRQEDWDYLYYNVTTDDMNTFILDSMTVGEYQVAQLTKENSACSFKLRETMILIEPPNEQLQLTIETNNPVCEGHPLYLNADLFPGGAVSWDGPNGFISSDANLNFEQAVPEQSGDYELIATYGICEQIRNIDVFVPPLIEASIDGKLEYCEREKLILKADGNGDLKTFDWSGPDNFVDDIKEIKIQAIAPFNEGVYEVIVGNGYCQDTASTSITVLPSPTILLDPKLETDFCGTVKLNPEITGDNNVSYSWKPTTGLSCYDCESPELEVPFFPIYKLSVINDYLCTDTSITVVSLLKDKLIYIPNAFSPNVNGVNDYFQFFPGCGVSKIKNLKVFNRWGATVFARDVIDSDSPESFWDGLINGNSAAVGIYIWQAEIELVDGTSSKIFGDVTLMK